MTGFMLMAQNANNGFLLSGSVIYEQTVQLNIQLEGDAAQFADAMPKERKSEKILHLFDIISDITESLKNLRLFLENALTKFSKKSFNHD